VNPPSLQFPAKSTNACPGRAKSFSTVSIFSFEACCDRLGEELLNALLSEKTSQFVNENKATNDSQNLMLIHTPWQ